MFPIFKKLKPVKDILDLKEKHRQEIWNLEYKHDNIVKNMERYINTLKRI